MRFGHVEQTLSGRFEIVQHRPRTCIVAFLGGALRSGIVARLRRRVRVGSRRFDLISGSRSNTTCTTSPPMPFAVSATTLNVRNWLTSMNDTTW